MPRILIVDDDEVDRELATRCLDAIENLEIAYAERAEEGLQSIAERTPDVVLTDLRMPGMDGLELVERVRSEYPLLPIVLMTSQGNELIAVQALRAGASSYVPKSALKSALVDSIVDVLEITAAKRSQSEILAYLGSSETHFELVNDPALILPLVGYLQENMARIGFGDDSLRTQVSVALMEAVSNAMIRGNLEVGSELRRSEPAAYHDLMQRRRRESPYAERRVVCHAKESTERIEYTIEDEGPGFDPESLPDPTAARNVLEVSGRGIMLIRTFMDEVRFNDLGNQITMTKAAPPRESASA
jgi:CheY-like chemotaxis protein